jgi:hypothetical protein
VPEAYFITVEEQGRKTLHMHICLWIKGFTSLRQKLQSSSPRARQKAKKDIAEYVDHCSTNELISPSEEKAIIHYCPTVKRNKMPRVVDEQSLRELRHKTGCRQHNGAIAYCDTCDKKWTNEELVEEYLKNKYPNIKEKMTTLHDKHNPYLEELVYRLQVSARLTDSGSINSDIIQALTNLHYTQHCKTCFKRTSECRYNMPKQSTLATTVQLLYTEKKWLNWNGTRSHLDYYSLIPKRHTYNLYMNNNCRAFSPSRIASNSNVRVLMHGRECFYASKYVTKSTQGEDTEGFQSALKYCEHRLSEIKHDSPHSESVSRFLGA